MRRNTTTFKKDEIKYMRLKKPAARWKSLYFKNKTLAQAVSRDVILRKYYLYNVNKMYKML